MSKILIDLNKLGKDNQAAIQGIKLFLSKNKNINLILLANPDNCLTIKDNKRVQVFDVKKYKKKIDIRYEDQNNSSLNLAMQLLNDSDLDIIGFVTYSEKQATARAAKTFLHQTENSPLYVATFANYKTHRTTCIGDLGYSNNPSINDYNNYLNLMTRYMQHAFKKENPEFKVLTLDKCATNELDATFKNASNYKGLVEGRELFKCDADIVLGNPHEFLGVISGIDHGISIYDEFIKDYAKKNVGIRLFSYPMFRSVLSAFHMEIDQKLSSGGNILLGFQKNIIVIDPGTIKYGVKVSLNLAANLEKF